MAMAVFSAGCAVVQSGPGVHGAEGTAYMLPRALLPVELRFDGSGFDLIVQAPEIKGDPGHVYALRRTGNIFTHDSVTINVDRDSLLTGVDVKSDDKSAQALQAVATGAGAKKAENVVIGGTAGLVFRQHFDPGWSAEQVREFNLDLQQAALSAAKAKQAELKCAPRSEVAACKAISRLVAEVEIAPLKLGLDASTVDNATPANCSAGFCYRINVPHVVRMSGAGISSSQLFALPNRSPTFVMPLERWAFVRTTHDAKLNAGMLSSVTTDRPSSALAVASVPFEIAKGAVSSMSELVQLKIDLSTKQTKLAQDQLAELQATLALKEAQEAAEKKAKDKGKDEPPGKQELGSASEGVAFSLRIGPPADATVQLKPGAGSSNPQEQAASGGGGSTSAGSGGTLSPGAKK